MKVLGLNASPRGKESQTLRLVIAVLDGAEVEGAKTELLDVCDYEIGFCTACGTCYAKGECTQTDDFPDIFDRMLDADGIVLGSPNYIDSVTAQMKVVFDRMADAIHCQMFSGKYGCSVCTAGGSNEMEVVGYMNRVLTSLGAQIVGGVGVAFRGNPDAILPARRKPTRWGGISPMPSARSAPTRIRRRSSRPAGITSASSSQANKDRWAHEYDWWVQAGMIKR